MKKEGWQQLQRVSTLRKTEEGYESSGWVLAEVLGYGAAIKFIELTGWRKLSCHCVRGYATTIFPLYENDDFWGKISRRGRTE
ncbi:hypothetical protein WN55_03426 [Dufourea novaeangliae]|uniref:Uncharacterized protein n=1 Tax=Dufourea novaeangliae TaxID=178035 RepID=A0A154PJC0_DUFNO|nr:hypothetical protein WN55_03426 [Dufourea novaeangliae]